MIWPLLRNCAIGVVLASWPAGSYWCADDPGTETSGVGYVKVVQQMLGHSSAAMTRDVYGHLFSDRLDEVADAVDSARTEAAQAAQAAL